MFMRTCKLIQDMYLWLLLIVNNRPDQPLFTQYFKWHGDVPSRVHVIRKSDGQLLTTINTTAMFVTHQVSPWRLAFEDGSFHGYALVAAVSSINCASIYIQCISMLFWCFMSDEYCWDTSEWRSHIFTPFDVRIYKTSCFVYVNGIHQWRNVLYVVTY